MTFDIFAVLMKNEVDFILKTIKENDYNDRLKVLK